MSLWRLFGFLFYVANYLKGKCLGSYWEARVRKRAARLGSININGDVAIYGCENIRIGENVHVGAGAFVIADGGLFIGDNTHISRNLTLYTRNHNYKGKKLPYDETQIMREVHIGKNVWIGMNVTILPGTRIGDGCIIGAGCVVYGNIESCSIIGAASYNRLGRRDEGHYSALDAAGSYGGANGK